MKVFFSVLMMALMVVGGAQAVGLRSSDRSVGIKSDTSVGIRSEGIYEMRSRKEAEAAKEKEEIQTKKSPQIIALEKALPLSDILGVVRAEGYRMILNADFRTAYWRVIAYDDTLGVRVAFNIDAQNGNIIQKRVFKR